MKKRVNVKPLLVDRNGKPLALSTTQYYSNSTSRRLNNTNYVSQRYFGGANTNEYHFLDPSERRLINQFALDLFRSSPTIHSAINKKNEWTCATGWKPLYRGSNILWGNQATDYM
jgi:putative IMPACT (imprinted ancient) family translation regulator